MYVFTAGVLAFWVISQNIRYAAFPPSKGEQPWPARLPGLLLELRRQTTKHPQTFVCLQEVLHDQLSDILNGLNGDSNDWTHIGVGRDDGQSAGEYSPILYRESLWHLQHVNHFWLSETPEKPSVGWDAGSVRIVTIGVFQAKFAPRRVVLVNTHLDNAGTIARRNGATMIVDAIKQYLNGSAVPGIGRLPVVLAGDMNSRPDQEAYMVFKSSNSPLEDVKTILPADKVSGPDETFTGFDDNGEGRLDYIFTAHPATYALSPLEYATLPNVLDDGVQFSDHRAVRAALQLLGR